MMTAHGPRDIIGEITLNEFLAVDDERVSTLAEIALEEARRVKTLLNRRQLLPLSHDPLLVELGGGVGRLSVDAGLFARALEEDFDPLSVDFCQNPVVEARRKLALQLSAMGLSDRKPSSMIATGLIQRLEKVIKRTKKLLAEATAAVVVESDVFIHNDLAEVAPQVRKVMVPEGIFVLCEPVRDFNPQYQTNPQKNEFTYIWNLDEYDTALYPLERMADPVHLPYFRETYSILRYALPNYF